MNVNTLRILELLLTLHAAAVTLIMTWQNEIKKRWLNRRWYMRPINTQRQEHGFHYTLFQGIKLDPTMFFRYTRMDLQTFNYLLELTEPRLAKKPTRLDIISAEQRLAFTLR